MDFRKNVVQLYKNGLDIDEIQKELRFQVEKETIEKWIEEEEIYRKKVSLIKKSIKIKKRFAKIKYMKQEEIDKLNQEHGEILRELIELDPENPIAKADYFITCYNLRNYEEAKKIGEEFIQKFDNEKVLSRLSNIYASEGDYEKAIECMKKVIELEPGNTSNHLRLKRLTGKLQKQKVPNNKNNQKSYKNDIELLKSLIYETSDNNKKMQLWQLIEQDAKKALAENPNNESMYGELMRALTNLGKLEESRKIGSELLKKNSTNIYALYEMSRIERVSKNFEEEREYLEKILELSPNSNKEAIRKKLEIINRIIKQEEETKKEEYIYNTSVEREQELFAKEQENEEEMYTEETQEEYIEKIVRKFKWGEIKKEDLNNIWDELQKYPDKTKSAIFIADLYFKITEQYKISLKVLEVYLDKAYTLTPEEYDNVMKEIVKYRAYINKNTQSDGQGDKQTENSEEER